MSQFTESRPPISIGRILAVVVPVTLIGVGAYAFFRQEDARTLEAAAPNTISRMFAAEQVVPEGEMAYPDADQDGVADPPADPALLVSPEVLTFSFVAGETESVSEDQCQELFAALKEKTGRDIKFVHYANVQEQLAALKHGECHIAGLNTGIVPVAVRRDGFVPLCTFGREDGTYGYTMQFIVPANSPIKSLKDIRGHKVMFTRLDSNSGFKAPLVLLLDEYKMLPDRDYQWGFSQGHEASIRGIAENDYEVAPVASDILARMIEKGDIDADQVRSIYTSERFPPATIGVVYNLDPKLRDAIMEGLLEFRLEGTGLAGEFGADVTRFVPVKYKDDWANTRRIDQFVAQVRSRR